MMKVISFASLEDGCDMEDCYRKACHEVDETIAKLKGLSVIVIRG
jgi:hypothetical protein